MTLPSLIVPATSPTLADSPPDVCQPVMAACRTVSATRQTRKHGPTHPAYWRFWQRSRWLAPLPSSAPAGSREHSRSPAAQPAAPGWWSRTYRAPESPARPRLPQAPVSPSSWSKLPGPESSPYVSRAGRPSADLVSRCAAEARRSPAAWLLLGRLLGRRADQPPPHRSQPTRSALNPRLLEPGPPCGALCCLADRLPPASFSRS